MTTSMSLDSLKPHILPITAALVVIATVPLAIIPWSTQILDNWEDISVQSALRDKLIAKADQLERFDVTQSRQLLQDSVEPALPASAEPTSALGALELIAQEVGLKIVGVDYANTEVEAPVAVPTTDELGTETVATEAPAVRNLNATITLDGQFPNIVSFVQKAEKMVRVVDVHTMHLTQNDPESDIITASFQFNAPYLPHPEDLGPIEEPFPELTASQTTIIDRVKSQTRTTYAPTNVETITGKPNPFQ